MKAKLLALQTLANRHYNKAGALALVAAPLLARAEVTASDIAPVVTGIAASIALIVLIGNAKLLVKVAIKTYGWLASAMR
jgi:hypothetical protein